MWVCLDPHRLKAGAWACGETIHRTYVRMRWVAEVRRRRKPLKLTLKLKLRALGQ